MNNDGLLDLFLPGLGDWYYQWNDLDTRLSNIQACMDFRTAKPIGQDIHDAALAPFRGYDTNLCLDGQGLRKIGQAEGDQTGIVMEVETTLEGVQLYTGNFISDRAGKNGARYASYSGFCLETQHYPDAINQPAFPSPVLRQGEALHETTVYRFCVRK